jgi:hypothetical protein
VDLLGDILSTLELRSTLYFGAELTARFFAGDLVLVPHGAAHVLADSPGRYRRALETDDA